MSSSMLLQRSGWQGGLVGAEGKSGGELLGTRCTDPAELQSIKSFLSCMLQHDPANRSSPQALLDHSWLKR